MEYFLLTNVLLISAVPMYQSKEINCEYCSANIAEIEHTPKFYYKFINTIQENLNTDITQ